tara:strand:- start:258 stop:515 length:258 start_codon:yes stop_codon:yes gene_type:complete
MEPITLIFLSGMVSGVIIGDAFDPIGIEDNEHVVQECTTKTTKSKIYDKELKDYINNEFVESTCIGRYIPPERPILHAIQNKIKH